MLLIRTLSAALVLPVLLALNGGTAVRHTSDFPHLTLWAWECPEQLTFLGSGDVGAEKSVIEFALLETVLLQLFHSLSKPLPHITF